MLALVLYEAWRGADEELRVVVDGSADLGFFIPTSVLFFFHP